nr:MAG TPA: hypothetical protein [Caudoviricetes sp.]
MASAFFDFFMNIKVPITRYTCGSLFISLAPSLADEMNNTRCFNICNTKSIVLWRGCAYLLKCKEIKKTCQEDRFCTVSNLIRATS